MGDFTIWAFKIGHSSSSSWSNHADEPSQMFAILNWKLKCRVRLVCWSVHFRCSRRRAVACILQRMAARDIFRHFSHVNPGITGMAFHPCCCCCVWCNSCCSCCCCFWCNSCCCWCCFWCNSSCIVAFDVTLVAVVAFDVTLVAVVAFDVTLVLVDVAFDVTLVVVDVAFDVTEFSCRSTSTLLRQLYSNMV